jgi:RHS repeat-associated protein
MQERFAYDYATGNLTSSEDPNSNTTGYQYEDSLNRLTEITYPDGGTTKYTYNDSVPSVETSTLLTGSTWKTSLSTMDGLGHVISASLTSDPEGADTIATTYDGEGRVYTQTNPERSGSSATDGTTTFTYDALGRKTAQLQQDNTSYLYWCYNGVQSQGNLNCSSKAGSVSTGTWVDSTDENGNHWQRASDALGRLTSVMEPNPTSNALALETDYTYDALDNLLTVNQKGGSGDTARPARTFSYDGLSRLVTSYNPETGTICYGTYSGSTCNEGYDANGNLIAKTDARGAVTNYTYDALNRPTKKSYPTIPSGVAPTSTVGYVYDVTIGGWGWPTGESQTNVVGRLSEVTVGSSGANAWTVYGYDPMGRVALKSECLPMDCGNNHHDLVSKYDLAGNLSFYSRGLNVDSGLYFGGYAQAYDGAGRLTSVTGDTEGTNLATSILSNTVYYPTGQLNQSLQLGKYSSTRTYSNRGWFTGQNITNTAGLASWSSSAAYDPAGRVSGTTDAYARSWSYTYDHLNRLSTASGPNGSLSYSIDNFGNKTEQTVTAGTGPAPDYGVATTNALTGNGLTYDLAGNAGNVTYDGFHYYTYDAEGRLYSVGLQQGNPTTCYTYDGDGDRVATTNCNVVNHGNGTTVGIETEFLYDPAHRLMAEIKITGYSGQLTRANIYAGGEFLAEDSPDPFLTNTATATQLRITDQVGSLRGLSDLGNPSNLWSGAWKSFPYGDGAVAGDGADSQDNPGGMLFTGKERDAESGLDDFGARYYASTMGRFMSPDPLLSSGRPENPQTWNRYTYGLNNPLSIIDPTGLYNLVNNCAGDDSKCNKAFAQDAKNLKDGLAALTTAVNGLKDGDQKTALQGALKAFGTENDGNNVGVQFGALSGNTAGNTALSVDSSGKFNFTVTFDPSKNQGMFNQAINAAHEGQHVEDISDPRYASDSTTLSPFQLEYRGYQTSSYAGQALGVNSLSYGKDVLWNSSWRAVDTQTLRDKGITQHVTSIPGHPEPQAPTPHDPWK